MRDAKWLVNGLEETIGKFEDTESVIPAGINVAKLWPASNEVEGLRKQQSSTPYSRVLIKALVAPKSVPRIDLYSKCELYLLLR